MLIKPKKSVKKSLSQEKKVIKATAKITPGIAYPEIENKLKLSKNLLLDILFPKFIRKEKLTKTKLAKKTRIRVLKFKDQRFVSWKYFGNLKVQ